MLQQIDLTIAKGEFVSLIGPSGCGKSTLLKLISGLTSATSGSILVDGMTPVNARRDHFLHLSRRYSFALENGDRQCRSGAGAGTRRP